MNDQHGVDYSSYRYERPGWDGRMVAIAAIGVYLLSVVLLHVNAHLRTSGTAFLWTSLGIAIFSMVLIAVILWASARRSSRPDVSVYLLFFLVAEVPDWLLLIPVAWPEWTAPIWRFLSAGMTGWLLDVVGVAMLLGAWYARYDLSSKVYFLAFIGGALTATISLVSLEASLSAARSETEPLGGSIGIGLFSFLTAILICLVVVGFAWRGTQLEPEAPLED